MVTAALILAHAFTENPDFNPGPMLYFGAFLIDFAIFETFFGM